MRPLLRLAWPPRTGNSMPFTGVCACGAFALLHTFNALYQTFHIHTLDMERRVVLELRILCVGGPSGVPPVTRTPMPIEPIC